MFVILCYDVNKLRVGKVLKVCRKYCKHVQKSVFEGWLTESQFNRLKKDIRDCVDVSEDSVCFYVLESTKFVRKEELGRVENNGNII